jgi:hypothetical protein
MYDGTMNALATARTKEEKRALVEAFQFLQTLERGEAVVVDIEGEEREMFVSRPLDLSERSSTLHAALWEHTNVHLTYGPGQPTISITTAQQAQKDELPFIVKRVESEIIRVVEIGPALYARIDELAGNRSGARKQLASVVKNMLAQRAKYVDRSYLK